MKNSGRLVKLPSLPNSRYIGTGLGLGYTDSGAQGKYSLFLNGTSGSLENAGLGLIIKSAVGTITNRTFTVTGAGLTITNGNGVSGNPTLTVAGLLYSLANLSGTGFIASNGSALTPLTLTGTALQIAVANGNGTSGNPVISFVNDAVFPGNAGITVPNGTTAQRPGSGNGTLRYNSDTGTFEGYANGVWGSITTGSGGQSC